ncbi:SET domain-containing protein [Aphelenchoides fujianensis]|nr:SET domain-containing protein [Aphelenchoides fujianensis]
MSRAERVARFVEWTRRRGVEADGAELREFEDARGCGLVATRTIRENETFLKIPKELMITAGWVAERAPFTEILRNHRLEAFPILVLFVYEESAVEQSDWRPFFDVLPAAFGTPLADGRLGAALSADCLPRRVRQLLAKQRREFEDVHEALSRALAPRPVDVRRLNWAWHVVNTRCIFVDNAPHPLVAAGEAGDSLAVIPLVDMLNHAPHAACVARFCRLTQRYVVAAERRCVRAGEELLVCYGPHDNARLWLEYGFRLPDNAHNRVDLPTELVLALAEEVGAEVTAERRRVIEEAALPCTLYASDVAPPYGLRKNAQLLQLPAAELKDAKKWLYALPADLEDDPQVDALVFRLLAALRVRLQRRAADTPPELRWCWTDQTDVLKNLFRLREAEREVDVE